MPYPNVLSPQAQSKIWVTVVIDQMLRTPVSGDSWTKLYVEVNQGGQS